MTAPLLVIGGGGHAKVLIAALKRSGQRILGVIDANPALHGGSLLGIPILGGDENLERFAPDDVALVNGVGMTGWPGRRVTIFRRFSDRGFRFAMVIDQTALVSEEVELGDGAQVLAGAILQPGVRIGANCIVNTGARIDHDTVLGSHAHVGPGATLSGGVAIGDMVFVGAGAVIRPCVRVGAGTVIGAGAAVVTDILPDSVVVGVPARRLRN